MEKATEKQIKFMKDLKLDFHADCTKEEAKAMINRKLNESEKVEESKAVMKAVETDGIVELKKQYPVNHTTMYTSYAKDIFCAAYNNTPDAEQRDKKILMKNCIDLVKQAREAFS